MAQCHVCHEWLPNGPGSAHECLGHPLPRLVVPAAPPVAPPMIMPGPPPNPGLNRRLQYYDRTHKLINENAANAVPAATRQKFDRAVETWLMHQTPGPSTWAQRSAALTVSNFIGMTDAERLGLIDIIWNEVLILKQCLTRRSQMVDPAPNAFQGLGQSAHGFRDGGYCFRCDTRDHDHVLAHGFIAAFALNPPADIHGTLPHRAAVGQGIPKQVAMWKDNRDAVSEMTVCVSRNMKGCTKFPYPEYVGAARIFAIKLPGDKVGFDTENWQANEVGGLWRPGEKAFLDIAPGCVVASVAISKEASAADDELHRFRLGADRWTYAPGATYADRAALGPELIALYNGGQSQAVLRADDFVMGQ